MEVAIKESPLEDRLAAIEQTLTEIRAVLIPCATTGKRPSIHEIKRLVCREFSVTSAELDSQKREQRLVLPRHIAIYLCVKLTIKSLVSIGKGFGGRDHATVLHAKEQITRLMQEDAKVRAHVDNIMAELSELYHV